YSGRRPKHNAGKKSGDSAGKSEPRTGRGASTRSSLHRVATCKSERTRRCARRRPRGIDFDENIWACARILHPTAYQRRDSALASAGKCWGFDRATATQSCDRATVTRRQARLLFRHLQSRAAVGAREAATTFERKHGEPKRSLSSRPGRSECVYDRDCRSARARSIGGKFTSCL